MRNGISGLPTPHPIGEAMPAVYAEDGFAQRFTSALDDVLAPIFATLDCFEAYLDPAIAPEDIVDWLADWVALPIDDSWSLDRRRELVRHAVQLHRWRGTKKGLAAHVKLLTGGEVEITDNGGSSWSATSNGDMPGSPTPSVEVLVRVTTAAAVDVARLSATVADAVPAHVPTHIRVVPTGRAQVRG
ncbi:phage tail protein [Phytomonospora sp. NPDC050363]|uniref:phage tail protein n=1 Tax=Phytomonospora sp. NPDC050363 TaxID=3155642 RepID=UPI0033E93711